MLIAAQFRSKAARRALARIGLVDHAAAVAEVGREGEGRELQDVEAKVPMPADGETSGVEFW